MYGNIEMAGAKKVKQQAPRKPVEPMTAMLRAVRKAEHRTADGVERSGTGFTIIKLRQPPMGHLIDDKKIGSEEVQAADQMKLAYIAIASRLMIRGASFERVDKSIDTGTPWPAITAEAVKNFQSWSNYWSRRSKLYGDPLLEIVVSAVMDERPIRQIATDLGFHHRKIERAVIYGLRDYAARNGMAAKGLARNWMDAAQSIFVPADPLLLDAIRRARIEV